MVEVLIQHSFLFIYLFIYLFIVFYVWLGFHRYAQFHITTPQRVIHIMHYSHTLRHIPAPDVCFRTLAEGVHRGYLWRSAQPRHTCAALIILLLISPISEGWKAESTLPPPGFESALFKWYIVDANLFCSKVGFLLRNRFYPS